jgi:hypothetical protein
MKKKKKGTARIGEHQGNSVTEIFYLQELCRFYEEKKQGYMLMYYVSGLNYPRKFTHLSLSLSLSRTTYKLYSS